MIWGLLALVVALALVGGCAIALGHNSRAEVKAETKREVATDTTTVEDVLIQKEKKP